MLGALEALGVDLVNIFRPRRPGGEPTVLGDHLQTANRSMVACRGGELVQYRIASHHLGFHQFRREVAQNCFLFGVRVRVQAGVETPAHFRFQCLGEDVFSLEISLGYQHRGIEKRLIGGPDKQSIHLLETAAGDSSCSYAGAFCQILEQLSPDCRVSDRNQALRVAAWELERIANHTGDLGALAGDVAFRPTMGYCGRIRGEFLNMTAALCGNRFGRGLLVPGGLGYEVDLALRNKLLPWLNKTGDELNNAIELLFDAPTVLDRFENTGTVSAETARDAGLVGVAARASGQRDVRRVIPMAGTASMKSHSFLIAATCWPGQQGESLF